MMQIYVLKLFHIVLDPEPLTIEGVVDVLCHGEN